MLYNKMIIALLLSGCSCVFFATDDKYAYCATAAHCVKGETSTARYNGKDFGIRWDHVDPKHDIAIGRADARHLPSIPANIAQAQEGEALILGYPQLEAAIRKADILNSSAIIDGSEKNLLALQPPIKGGTSGGAVMQDGNLVGIVTHSTPTGGACVPSGDLFKATQAANIDLSPQSLSTRDGIIAALAVWLFSWWKARNPSAPTTSKPPNGTP